MSPFVFYAFYVVTDPALRFLDRKGRKGRIEKIPFVNYAFYVVTDPMTALPSRFVRSF